MRIQDMLNWFNRQEPIRQNTVALDFTPDGKLKFRPTMFLRSEDRSYSTLRQAFNATSEAGLTGVQDYSPDMPFGSQAIMRDRLALLKEEFGDDVRVTVESYNFGKGRGASGIQGLRDRTVRDGNAYGYLTYDGEKAVLQRIFVDGQEYTDEQIEGVFRKQGFYSDPTEMVSKFNKRIKAITTAKRVDSIQQDPVRVLIEDATSRLRGEALTHPEHARAIDGALEVSTFQLQKQREYILKEIDNLETLRGSYASNMDRVRVDAQIKKQRNALKEIDGALDGTNKTFNVRVLNFDLIMEDMTDEQAKTVREYFKKLRDGSSIKGNATLSERLDQMNRQMGWDRTKAAFEQTEAFKRRAIDFATDFRTIKGDRFGSVLENLEDFISGKGVKEVLSERRGGGFVSMEANKFGYQALDIQSMTAYPELYDKRVMGEITEESIQRTQAMISALDEPGQLPPAVRTMLERQAGVDPGMANSQIDQLDPRTMQEAEDILRMVDDYGMDVSSDPFLKRRVLKLIKEGSTKKGMLRMDAPNAFRAYVGTEASDPFSNLRTLQQGQIGLDPETGRLIMSDIDFIRYYPRGGGPDLDDALNAMIRVGEGGKLRAVITRSPLARGEIDFFNVQNEHEFFERILIKKIADEDEVQQLSRRTVRELYADLLQKDEDFIRFKAGFVDSDRVRIEAAAQVGDYDTLRGYFESARGRNYLTEVSDEASNMASYSRALWETADIEARRSPMSHAKQLLESDTRLSSYKSIQRQIRKAERAGNTQRVQQLQRALTNFLTSEQVGLQALPESMEAAIPRRTSEAVNLFKKGGFQFYKYEGEGGNVIYKKSLNPIAGKTWTELSAEGMSRSEFRIRQLEAMENAMAGEDGGFLGRYINARMAFDNFNATNDLGQPEVITKANARKLVKDKKLNVLLEQEEVIDTLIGMGGDVKQATAFVDEMIYEMHESMVKQAMMSVARGDPKSKRITIDRGLMEVGKFKEQDLRGIFSKLADDPQFRGVKFDDILNSEGVVAQVLKRQKEMMTQIDEQIANISLADQFKGLKVTDSARAQRDARTVKAAFNQAMGELRDFTSMDDIDDIMKHIDETGGMPGFGEHFLEKRVTAALAETFDVREVGGHIERVAGTRTLEAMSFLDDNVLQRMPPQLRASIVQKMGGVSEIRLPDMTLSRLNEYFGEMIVPGEEMERALRQVLDEGTFNKILQTDAALGALDDSDRLLSPNILDALGTRTRSEQIFVTGDRFMRSMLDPDMVLRAGGDEAGTVGQYLMEAMSPDADRASIARQMIRGAAEDYLDVLGTWTQAGEAPSLVGDVLGDRSPPPGMTKKIIADAAAEASGEVTETITGKSGFINMAQDVLGTKAGRYGLAGLAALAGVGVINAARNKGDRTIEDMQGPANLPGGNPYTRLRGMPNLEMPQYSPQSSQGMTYEVRGNGGNAGRFEEAMNSLTGSPVTTTTYDRGGFTPFVDEWY